MPPLEGVIDKTHNVISSAISSPQLTHLIPPLNVSQAASPSSVSNVHNSVDASKSIHSATKFQQFANSNALDAITTTTTIAITTAAITTTKSAYIDQQKLLSLHTSNFVDSSTATSNTRAASANSSNATFLKGASKMTAEKATTSIPTAPPVATVVKFSSKNKELLVFNPIKSSSSVKMIPVMITRATASPITTVTTTESNDEFNFTFSSLDNSEEDVQDFSTKILSATESATKATSASVMFTRLASTTEYISTTATPTAGNLSFRLIFICY